MLLDTCTLIWLSGNRKELSLVARQLIAANAGSLYISAISAWEIAVKSSTGKLVLPTPVDDWYHDVLIHHGIEEIPVTGKHGIASAELPRLHSDPADRIIIATALAEGLTLLTPDPTIRQYPNVKLAW
jgi:PIN domain nuclease of toxin-antitoxin system